MRLKRIKSTLAAILSIAILSGVSQPIQATTNSSKNIKVELGFKPLDMVKNYSDNTIYAIDGSNKKVVAIDMNTLEKRELTFDKYPTSLYIANDKLYVSLIDGTYEESKSDKEKGQVVVVDRRSLEVEKSIDLKVKPFDIVVNGNYLYVTSMYWEGSVKNFIVSYSLESGNFIGEQELRKKNMNMSLNSNKDKIYMRSESWKDYETEVAQVIMNSDGKIGEPLVKNINENLKKNISIAPNSDFMIVGSGIVVKCSNRFFVSSSNGKKNYYEDMKYMGNIAEEFTTIDYNSIGTEGYMGDSKGNLKILDMNTLNIKGRYNVNGKVEYIFESDESIDCVYQDIDSKYYIENINKENFRAEINNKIVWDPKGYEYNNYNGKAYIADAGFNRVYIFDTIKNVVEDVIQLDYQPISVTYNKENNRLYIGYSDAEYKFGEYNLDTKEVRNINGNLNLWDTQVGCFNNVIYAKKEEKNWIAYNPETLNIIEDDEIGALLLTRWITTKDNKTLFTWGSNTVRKYHIEGGKLILDSEYNEYNPYFYGYGDSTIGSNFLDENEEYLYINNLKISTTDINQYSVVDKSKIGDITAWNHKKTVFANADKLHLTTRNLTLANKSTNWRKIIFFNKDGILYTLNQNEISSKNPWQGDTNGDLKVDILDIANVANAYGKAIESEEYKYVLDGNQDRFIDIYDLTFVSNKID